MMRRREGMRCFRVVVDGCEGVGKSSIVLQWISSVFVERWDPTMEDSYRKQFDVDGVECLLDVLDSVVVGQDQPERQLMREQYLKLSDGFVIVYSVTSMATFSALSGIHREIITVKGNGSCNSVASVPIALVGTKCDLTQDRAVTTEAGQELATQWGCGTTVFVESSARTRLNIDKIFVELVRLMRLLDPQPKAHNDPCLIC
ncbi:small GTPase superfamily [Pelomyxa schiedti]|nr:small GTPase superfamily [Pelomyxa schiedti]